MASKTTWIQSVARWLIQDRTKGTSSATSTALLDTPSQQDPAPQVQGTTTPTNPSPVPQPPAYTSIPMRDPIELVSYYPEFAFYYPQCEMATKAWFVENTKRDWVIFDCGANIGYYAILFSQLAPEGKIHAFEPTSTYDMMLKNLAHAGVANVLPRKLALGRHTGSREDGIFRIWGTNPEVQAYDFTTIDDYVKAHGLDRVDCIKIDVDSFDFEVLQGAEKTLKEFDPIVVVELNHALGKRGQTNTEALEWMWRQGYRETLVLDLDNFIFRRGQSVLCTEPLPELRVQFGASLKPE